MTDLALDNRGDLKIVETTNDIALVQGKDSLLQRKQIELSSFPSSLVEAPFEGVLFDRETKLDKIALLELAQTFSQVFLRDLEIESESVKVTPQTKDNKHIFIISFRTTSGESLQLAL